MHGLRLPRALCGLTTYWTTRSTWATFSSIKTLRPSCRWVGWSKEDQLMMTSSRKRTRSSWTNCSTGASNRCLQCVDRGAFPPACAEIKPDFLGTCGHFAFSHFSTPDIWLPHFFWQKWEAPIVHIPTILWGGGTPRVLGHVESPPPSPPTRGACLSSEQSERGRVGGGVLRAGGIVLGGHVS